MRLRNLACRTRKARLRCLAVVILSTLCGAAGVSAREATENPRQRRGQAIQGMIESVGEESLQQFIDLHVGAEWRESMPTDELLAQLRVIRAACTGFGGVLWNREGEDSVRITFLQGPQQTSLVFRLEPAPPHQIVAIELEPARAADNPTHAVPQLEWDSLAEGLETAARDGFAGTVLVVRHGAIVLHQGYGLADRERGIANGSETIFAIGSVPIDFTKAAILKLEEAGKLRTSDPITKYLTGVPEDKAAITLDHLMTGRSGLPNFHHVTGVDADPDLAWIDRETAVRRILARDLLFAPGRGRAHSHSAWGLLAAIVEIASHQSYAEYLRDAFFVPAGMTRTGFHADTERFSDADFATGYGHQKVGAVNSPLHWGPTSWLVMGSGGMNSTPLDLYKWMTAIRQGKTLSPASATRYWTHGVLNGGDMRGFLCLYTEGPDDLMILCSNAHQGPADLASAVGERLAQLVMQGSIPPYSLGIAMDVDAERGVKVRAVMPRSAAARDGLRVDDILLAANGQLLRGEVREILQPLLRKGEPITFDIERAGQRNRVTVTPNPRATPPD